MSERSDATRQMIERRLKEELGAERVEILDESWKHAGHAAAGGGGHFIVRVVSAKFEGVPLLDRNRMVFRLFEAEMGRDIHALAIKALTPAEWALP
ncbi:MAG: BolA family transcriptional regulator [Nitrospirae bacterium]|nr:BolA family transcriptional regulator [Nitrospirota bacterium]